MPIRCWTVMRHAHRHVTHHVYPHVRRVARHAVVHKAAVAVPIVVCAAVGGGAWYHPTTTQALPSSATGFSGGAGGPSGSVGSSSGSGFFGPGGNFIPETFLQDLPQTVFSELLTTPTGGGPSGLFNLYHDVPSELFILASEVPITAPVENQPIPEGDSAMMLLTMLGASLALWSRRKVMNR